MEKSEFEKTRINFPLILYSFFTVFMVFFSVSAIHNWPDQFAQITITLACIITTLLVLMQNIPSSIPKKNWPKELKLVLIIMFLGVLNVCFSEYGSNYTDYIRIKTTTEQKPDNDDRTNARKMVDAYESLFSNPITHSALVEFGDNILGRSISPMSVSEIREEYHD